MTIGIIVFAVVVATTVVSVYIRKKRDSRANMPHVITKSFTAATFPEYVGTTDFIGFDGLVSPIVLPGSARLRIIADASGGAVVQISGFKSNPGAGYLISIQCNGVTMHGRDAIYSHSVGSAEWTWTGRSFGFVLGAQYGFDMTIDESA